MHAHPSQLLCVVNEDIPWGASVCESTPGENACQFSWTMVKRIGNRAGWVWRAYLRSPFCRALALVCAVLSGLIIWSEVGVFLSVSIRFAASVIGGLAV